MWWSVFNACLQSAILILGSSGSMLKSSVFYNPPPLKCKWFIRKRSSDTWLLCLLSDNLCGVGCEWLTHLSLLPVPHEGVQKCRGKTCLICSDTFRGTGTNWKLQTWFCICLLGMQGVVYIFGTANIWTHIYLWNTASFICHFVNIWRKCEFHKWAFLNITDTTL